MKKVIFATGNEGKMKEIREILGDLDIELLSLKDAGIHADIVEDGKTFEENAQIKAKAIRDLTGEIVLADDSGLEIDYLNKEPGIYSARYMGEDTSYHIKNAKLIERLEGVPDEKRTARFVCAIAAAFPDGSVKTVREAMEGRPTASATTRSFISRSTAAPQQNSPWKKKTRSATEGRLCAPSRTHSDENPRSQRHPRQRRKLRTGSHAGNSLRHADPLR